MRMAHPQVTTGFSSKRENPYPTIYDHAERKPITDFTARLQAKPAIIEKISRASDALHQRMLAGKDHACQQVATRLAKPWMWSDRLAFVPGESLRV